MRLLHMNNRTSEHILLSECPVNHFTTLGWPQNHLHLDCHAWLHCADTAAQNISVEQETEESLLGLE